MAVAPRSDPHNGGVGETMLAARWHGRGDVRVEAVPIPRPGPGEVVLRVAWCGICGTDLEEYRDGPVVIPVGQPNPLTGQRAPVTLGHEFAGTVAAVGEGVPQLREGDRVAPEICLACGRCFYCRRGQYALCVDWAAIGLHGDGGLAEYVRLPARQCLPLPNAIPDDEAALIETTEVAVRAMRKAPIEPGDPVVVVGDGAVGLIGLQVATAAGAGTVVLLGHREARLAIGREVGATAAIDSRDATWRERLLELTGGLGAAAAIECGGSPGSIRDAVRATRKGATVVHQTVAAEPVALDTWPLVEGERTIVGSVQHHRDEDLPQAIELLASGRVRVAPLITRRIALTDVVAQGFEAPRGDDVKVLVSTG